MVKNPSATAEETEISPDGKSLKEVMATHSSRPLDIDTGNSGQRSLPDYSLPGQEPDMTGAT